MIQTSIEQEKKQELRNDRNIWEDLDAIQSSFNILPVCLTLHADMMPTSNHFGCYDPRTWSIGLLSNIMDALKKDHMFLNISDGRDSFT